MNKPEKNIDPFDFDTLSALALNDPQAFEALRKQLINDAINTSSNREHRRLHGLQFQIDSYRRTAKNPMESCLKISRLMHESLDEFSSLLTLTVTAPEQAVAQLEQRQTKQSSPNVIHFDRAARLSQQA